MDLTSRPPWSSGAARRLGDALRDGAEPLADGPSYDDLVLWHGELAAEVNERIEGATWSIQPHLLATKAVRMGTDLRVGWRPKTQDTLVQKLQRLPSLKLDRVQDLAGVRVDADLYLDEQTQLAREIAAYFGADEPAIVDRRDGSRAGYRGVHVCLRFPAGRVEVQVRTLLQSIWANVYEKLADDVGRGIRYGQPAVPPPGYNQAQADQAVEHMQKMSEMIAAREADWQHYVDERHSAAIGANAMQKAMMIGAIVVAIRKFKPDAEAQEGA
jgi:ppGpp synthetase/RelA/SpoT-type nucleotidyltranferase